MNTSSAVRRHEGAGSPEPAPPAPPEEQEDLRLGRRIAAMGVTALIIVVYVLHAALPATPFQLPFENRRAIQTILPEGWAFFTISPRSPDIVVVGRDPDGGWKRLTVNAHATPASLLGLNRLDRSQGNEVAIIANQVPQEVWIECDLEPTVCLSQAKPERTVSNFSSRRSICGDVGLIMQEVLPWAWRGLPATMPSKVVRVVATC